MKRWRIIENGWNKKAAPWTGAIGIEEIDPDLEVPSIVCWFTRGWEETTESGDPLPGHPALRVVELHNKQIDE